jgi:hypothetical protein
VAENGSVSAADMQQVLEPELNSGSFDFGKNPDGKPRTWKMQPLPWRYEKSFRKQVMPLLAVTFKPFEVLLSGFGKGYMPELNPGVVKTFFDAEAEMDDYLAKAVWVILYAQDQTIKPEWVEENAESRDQLLAIVQRQCEIHKVMDRLGELLAERLGKLAQMMGLSIDLPTLKLAWKQASEVLSARIMTAASTVRNATGQSMESSLGTTSQRFTTKREQGQMEYVGVSTKTSLKN